MNEKITIRKNYNFKNYQKFSSNYNEYRRESNSLYEDVTWFISDKDTLKHFMLLYFNGCYGNENDRHFRYI
jgi:hypothetical protein